MDNQEACQQWQAILVQHPRFVHEHAKLWMEHAPRLSVPYAVVLSQQPRIVAFAKQ
jgi:hypothetical protein